MRLSIPFTLLLLSGCVVPGVRTRASHDLRCAEDAISVTPTGAGGYRAVGCARSRTYACVGTTCVGETTVEDVNPPAPGRDEDVAEAIVRATYAPMRACLGHANVLLTLDVDVGSEGTIRPLEIHQRVGPHEASCISRVAREASNPAWGEAGRLMLAYAVGGPPPESAEPSFEPVAGPSPTMEPPTLRALVEARRVAILACAPGDAIALVIEWNVDGTLVARMRDRAGSPEEGCIASVLANERLDPAPGGSGSLLHVIEAR